MSSDYTGYYHLSLAFCLELSIYNVYLYVIVTIHPLYPLLLPDIILSILFASLYGFLMEYITLRLDSTNEVEQWYVMHNYFYCLIT